MVDVDNRIGCAESLAAAADQGTAVALVYALRTDPKPPVREVVARVMGTHRLESYVPVLQTQASQETDPTVKSAVAWALAEIARDPVKMTRRSDHDWPRTIRDWPRARCPEPKSLR